VDGSTKHPQDAFLIDVVRVLIVVGTAVGDIIYDRVERENDVWQHKKVTDPLPKRRFFLLIAHVIEIKHQSEHKHGAQNRNNRT